MTTEGVFLWLASIFISRSLGLTTNYKTKVIGDSPIVSSFNHREFHPRISPNPHFQTIVGSEALRTKLFGEYPRKFRTSGERLKTTDGDFFDVEWTENIKTAGEVVLILHGLESNIKGALVTKMGSAFLSKSFACCLVSFRGCNGEDNDRPGAYHLGFTDDLHALVELVSTRYPEKRIYIAGFSLGGNVCLKYLGEIGSSYLEKRVFGGVATCVPFDPVASQGKIDRGFNRAVYSENFLSTLKKKAERQIERYPGAFDMERVKACNTIGDFDDAFIAPIYGFKDKVDYYRRTGSKWWLREIRAPCIAINALDDPFVEESSLPTADDIGSHAPVRLIYHERGGHCGFWGEDSTEEKHGWLAEEMARALRHIHDESVKQ